MQIQTMSIVIGDNRCNAACPFCISKQTGLVKCPDFCPEKIQRNRDKALSLAEIGGVTTVLLTGKGEPTLYAKELTNTIAAVNQYNIPFTELQTNGYELSRSIEEGNTENLELWHRLGLTTIILSAVHYSDSKNKEIMFPNSSGIKLAKLVPALSKLGFLVRLNCTMLNGYIDDEYQVKNMIDVAQDIGANQVTFRPVKLVNDSKSVDVAKRTKAFILSAKQIKDINKFFLKNSDRKIMSLMHDSDVYDIGGISVCNGTCLTHNKNKEEMRQIIFYNRTGKLTYDWEFEGAILLPEVVANYIEDERK